MIAALLVIAFIVIAIVLAVGTSGLFLIAALIWVLALLIGAAPGGRRR